MYINAIRLIHYTMAMSLRKRSTKEDLTLAPKLPRLSSNKGSSSSTTSRLRDDTTSDLPQNKMSDTKTNKKHISSSEIRSEDNSESEEEEVDMLSITWPVDTSMKESRRRDRILRPYIEKRNWHPSLEFQLIRKLLIKPIPTWWSSYAKEFPLLFDYEWRNPLGLGDLIFTDGHNNFLIAEVKTLETEVGIRIGKRNRERIRRKRRHVEEQTECYSRKWHELNPQAKKTVGVCVTERGVDEVIQLTERLKHVINEEEDVSKP